MDESDESAKLIALAAEWFIRAISNNDRNSGTLFGLSGSTGCGKTHAAKAIFRFVESWSVDILFAHRVNHWENLFVEWRDIAEVDDEDDFKRKCYDIERATFIVIDDIGSESDRFKNGAAASRLRRVLSMVEHKWVVVTSNLNLEQLLECYDVRSADRLRAYYWVQVGDVPSYRPKLKERHK